MLFANPRLLTVWELACGDVEASLSFDGGDTIHFVNLDPVGSAVLNTLIELGEINVDRPGDDGDHSDVLRVRTYHF